MAQDPIVRQVRAVRKEIEQQYPDAESFYKHLEQQQQNAHRIPLRGFFNLPLIFCQCPPIIVDGS